MHYSLLGRLGAERAPLVLVVLRLEQKVRQRRGCIDRELGVVPARPIARRVRIAHLVPHTGQTVHNAGQSRQHGQSSPGFGQFGSHWHSGSSERFWLHQGIQDRGYRKSH